MLAELDVGVARLLGLGAALVDGLGDLDHLAHPRIERLFALVAAQRLVEADLALLAVYLNFVPGGGVLALLPFGTGPLVCIFAVLIGIVGGVADPLWRLTFGWLVTAIVGGGWSAFRGPRNIVPFFRPAICNLPFLLQEARVWPAVGGVAGQRVPFDSRAAGRSAPAATRW